MSVTTKDIAQACGVSRATVTRALNNEGRINPRTKEMIIKTAKKMGYRPDLLARSLVTGRTMLIGAIVFDVSNRYFAQMINSIEIEAKRRGYFVNISLHEKDKNMETALLQRLVDYHVDGIILSPVNAGKEFAQFLNSLKTPIIVIGNEVDVSIPSVRIDEEAAVEEAVEHMARKGYERIVFVCPPLEDKEKENIYSHELRRNGFLKAVVKYKDLRTDIIGNWNYLEAVDTYIKDKSLKTAFFCSGDIYALNILKHLREKGIKIPKDLGLMGFDNIDILEYVTPKLTTIHNSVEDVSKKAVDLLLQKINGEEIPGKNILPHYFVEGETL